ncbi:cyclin-D1-1-like [Carica papaya]|uniref:cyclin-D1-1-like n=1 Tax=Carica papaya TaxID=3649 RepID=UPI000B8C99CA|nr:cyclin-D1-1-like [Carica papaya]
MSASDECRTLLLLPPPHSLYCNETASDVLLDHVSSCGTDTCDGHGTLDTLDDEDEDSVECMFDSELDRMLSVTEISDLREVVAAAHRDDAVHWMFEVHSYYGFKPETIYLSVNYLNRFLCSKTLPKNKAWAIQLAAIACLAVAVKMEEREVPFLLDLQIKKPKFLFKPKTIQRMELVVMGNLKWRLRIITPFNFLPYFTSNLLSCSLPTKSCCFTCILSLASHLIITTCTA